MFEEKEVEQAVEEASEILVESTEDVSAEETPTAPAELVAETKNYLNPELFDDIRVVARSEMTEAIEPDVIDPELEKAYSGTLIDISEHQLINGRVVGMNERDVLIDIGFKSEGIIDRSEFDEEELPAIGDQVEVYLEFIEDASGNTILSKEKADFMRRWRDLREAFENETIITGTIVRRIKGGLIVDLGIVQAFLPGSQIDIRPIQDFDVYLDKEIEIRIVKLNESRKNMLFPIRLSLRKA